MQRIAVDSPQTYNMKFTVALLLTALLGFVAPLYAPWWSFAITSFIVALAVHQKPLRAFLAGFTGLFLLWGAHAAWLDIANDHLLSDKIAAVLKLGNSGFALVVLTAFIGALISGLAALSGSFARQTKKRAEA